MAHSGQMQLDNKFDVTHTPQSSSLQSLHNYIINLIKREKSDSPTDRVYHAAKEYELVFCFRLG